MAGMLEDDAPSTTARGVLEGLAQALTLIKDMAADNPTLKNFKIQMHYPFVLRNMADRLDTIIARGGRLETCRVAHFECYRSLYGPLTNLEKTGIQIQFWNNHAYNARNVAKLCLKENSQASSQQG
ncbi:hypothetical protein RRF57_001057 [Xylaria bambusicola]|uniref:Uncharacterized protein n=1 Tax=Xylaria bambusicola TaxID=326684 RepID=A0AAN7Z5Y1_9PEZI